MPLTCPQPVGSPVRRALLRAAQALPAASLAASLAAAPLLGGCVYRIDIQQGNVIEQDSVEQVEVGMTRSQVQFLLGTPMVSDTFHDDRWDYTYYFREGRERNVDRRWLIVYFDDDRVARIEHRIDSADETEPELELDPERGPAIETVDRDPESDTDLELDPEAEPHPET